MKMKAIPKSDHKLDHVPLAEQSDESLLLRYRDAGDRQAFEILVHRYERELFNYLKRYVGDASLAEDAFQSAFLQVHLKSNQFEAGRKFRPWLYSIAINQAIDAQRRARNRRMLSLDREHSTGGEDSLANLMGLLVDRQEMPGAQLESNERKEWVRKTLDSLPDSLRAVVHLIYYQGLKYREAAEILDVPVGTVKSRMHAALLKLNEAFNAAFGSPSE